MVRPMLTIRWAFDEDGRGVTHEPLEMFQLVAGQKRLDVEIVAGEGKGVGNSHKELLHQRGLARLPGAVENYRHSWFSQAGVHLWGNGP
jgi:hypothetical protein